MSDINKSIRELVNYGLHTGLVVPEDEVYTINRILEILKLDEYKEPENACPVPDLESTLGSIMDWAYENGVLEENTVGYRDLFDTKLMGALVPAPSMVIAKFGELYRQSPQKATDFYYKFSRDTDYIRRYRIAKDMKWTAETEYGTLDVTINLSKPEKDPKAIAAAKNAKQSAYPKCLLCRENEGYAGRLDHPARQSHRIMPLTIEGEKWGFQYSPYVYYNEHCIVFNQKHTPMKIDEAAFRKLLAFVKQFPHYFLGSNADLPIVGGSILAHEHFQGGHYEFAMERAEIEKAVRFRGYADVEAGIVRWPLSVLRLRSENRAQLAELAEKILNAWRGYSDPDAFVFAQTDGEPHNTITPIVRRRGDAYEMDLVLRNNITTPEHPLGVFHPHAQLHHIKKENIGLIEVMGLAVLPSRLNTELAQLREAILTGRDIRADETLGKHADWLDELKTRHRFTPENTEQILRQEVGAVFEQVLEDAGVFKRNEAGQRAFLRFLGTLGMEQEEKL